MKKKKKRKKGAQKKGGENSAHFTSPGSAPALARARKICATVRMCSIPVWHAKLAGHIGKHASCVGCKHSSSFC